ncbi:MAG: hypothetical protein N2C12_01225, partial [Planctomycetales bacterium]
PPAQKIEEGSSFTPIPCQQCQNPPCTNVCPVGATFSTPEGPVLIDVPIDYSDNARLFDMTDADGGH